MKLSVGLGALILSVAACSCSKAPVAATTTDEWSVAEKLDPISQQKTLTATKELTSEQDENLAVDAEWSCPSTGAGNPSALQLTLTVYDKSKKVGDVIQGADVDAETIEYRLDEYGAGTVGKTGSEKFANEIPLNYLAMVGNSEKLAATTGGMIPMLTLASAVDPTFAAQLTDQLRAATGNFRWGSKQLTIRFRASTSVGANDHVFTLPLQTESVVKVAKACGWSVGTQASVAPAPAVEAAATGSEEDASSTPSLARAAQCDIMLSPTEGDTYKGPCLFEAAATRDGSFTITRDDGPLTRTVGAITLNIIRPNVGTITTNGAGGAGVDTWDVEFERRGACWVQSGDGDDGASICVK